jgi:hypothetical protein
MHKFSENWMLRVLLWSENVISFTNEMELWQGIFLHRTSAKNWFEHLITSIKSFKMLDLLHFGRSKSSGFFATLLVPERSMHWKKVPRTNEEHDFEAICTEVGTLIGGPTFVLCFSVRPSNDFLDHIMHAQQTRSLKNIRFCGVTVTQERGFTVENTPRFDTCGYTIHVSLG